MAGRQLRQQGLCTAGTMGRKHRFHSVHAPANTPARCTHIDWSGFWFEVLWWAGRFEPRFSDQARRHCAAYLRLGFQRPDGSSHHGLSFDEHTGAPLEFAPKRPTRPTPPGRAARRGC